MTIKNLEKLSFTHLLGENPSFLFKNDATAAEPLSQCIQQASCLVEYFKQHDIKVCALNIEDQSEFVAVLLACVYSGVDIELPSNNTEAILSSLTADIYFGRFVFNNNDLINKVNVKCKTINLAVNTAYDIAISLFTSGSTGEPKKITRKFSQLVNEVNTLEQLWGHTIPADAVFAGSVSQQHIYGLLFRVLWPLLSGRLSWNPQIPFEESLEKLAKQQHFVVFVSSPAFLKRIHEQSSVPQGRMLCFSSGGLLTDEEQLIAEKKLNNQILQIYGSSETGGIAYRPIDDNWHFFDQVKHQVKEGVLWVKSEHCYQNGWMNTQDKINILSSHSNKELVFELLGRADRIVKIEEKRISLELIEAELKIIELIFDAKTLVWQGNRQSIAAVIKLSPLGESYLSKHGSKKLKTHIKSMIKTKVDTLAIPRYIRFVDELPQDSQGKYSVADLKALFK